MISRAHWGIMLALGMRTIAASMSMVLKTKECLRVKPVCIEKNFLSLPIIYKPVSICR